MLLIRMQNFKFVTCILRKISIFNKKKKKVKNSVSNIFLSVSLTQLSIFTKFILLEWYLMQCYMLQSESIYLYNI